MERIVDLLQKLDNVTSKSDYNFFRRGSASLTQIEYFEKKLDVKLTADLSAFYQRHNGGFISLGDRTFLGIKHPNDFDDAEWVSNVFLSLEEIIAAYFQERGSYGFVDIRQFEKDNERLIPMMITKDHEYYLLRVLQSGKNGLVKLSHNYLGDDKSGYLIEPGNYDQFEDLLESYIINEGKI